MAFTPVKKHITNYVKGAILADKRWVFEFFTNSDVIDYPFGAAVGVQSVPLISDVAAQTPDGTTIQADSVTNSLIDMTIVDGMTTMHVSPKNARSFDLGDASFMQGFLDLSADAFVVLADDQQNDDIATATPAGASITIPAGLANFAVDTTSADTINASAYQINATIAQVVGGVAANNGGSMMGMMMKCAKTAWTNLLALATSGLPTAITTSGLRWDAANNLLSWTNIPIYLSSATEENNWGVVSKACLYCLQERSYAMVMDEVDLLSGGIIYDGSGRGKLIPVGVWGRGVIQDTLMGEAVNDTS